MLQFTSVGQSVSAFSSVPLYIRGIKRIN